VADKDGRRGGTSNASRSHAEISPSWRILHIAKRYWPYSGGQERYVQDLVRAQTRLGHRCVVVTADRDLVSRLPGTQKRRESVDGIDVLRVRAWGGHAKQFLAELPSELVRAIRWADVVHHHDPRFAFETSLLAAAAMRRPVIVHTHGLFFHTSQMALLKRMLMRAYYGPLFNRAVAAVVADSRTDERNLAELARVGPRKVRFIQNGIDLARFPPAAIQPEAGRLFMFGRLAEHKGHVAAMEALALVDVPWRLSVAGTGSAELQAALELRGRELGLSDRVEWLGEITDDALAGWIARARLVLFPSRFEGFGLALLEALAGGGMVLANRIHAHEEILGSGPLADRLVDFGQPQVAAARITAELATPIKHLAAVREAARRRASDFSMDRVAEEINDLYRELPLKPRR
jgi:alpha-1,3-mannosyltransferase